MAAQARPGRLTRGPTAKARAAAWLAVFSASLALAPAAAATFHEIKVREVYAGSANDSYVELQMYARSQNFVEGHQLKLYDSSGSLLHTSTFPTPSGVSNGSNQATILIGDTSVASAFGVTPDLVDAGLEISAAGGAACWIPGTLNADCVAWGGFPGPTAAGFEAATSTSAGSPASPAGITTGKAIRRKIAPGCQTLLEAGDDSNDSATDFAEVNPAPRNNTSAITETACTAPSATIDSKPSNPTGATDAAFTYHSTPAGASFECKLDAEAFAPCEATGKNYLGPLGEGSHTFQVRAHNANGTGTAASYTWKVDLTPPEVTVLSGPADPSPGGSAAFKYNSSESPSTFQCSLEPEGEPAVFSNCAATGKTYPDAEHPAPLANGIWTFEVRATDQAGNRSTPGAMPAGTYSWEVDNSLTDETPPETTLLSKPANPSESSTAAFTYESNEANSSFECALDAGPFAPCPAAGVLYSGLTGGPHSFQVRAIDASGNIDPTPARYSFDVVLAFAPSSPALAIAPIGPAAPPNTILLRAPAARTHDRTPSFSFRASQGGSSFECRLDRGSFRGCRSPLTTRPLLPGRHVFAVRAVAGGQADPSPAHTAFKLLPPASRSRSRANRQQT